MLPPKLAPPPKFKPLRGSGPNRNPGAPTAGAVHIRASVGKGGANAKADVKGVQIALNATPAALGGASQSLAVDGFIGPKTLAAITHFQETWLTVKDSRCDPGGPTLGLLNAMVGVGDALPPGAATANASSGRILKRPGPRPLTDNERRQIADAEMRQFVVDHHHMGLVYRWLLTTLRVVSAAQRHIVRLQALPHGASLPATALGDHERAAFLLMAKTFKLSERKPPEAAAAAALIDTIFRRSTLLVSHRVHRPPIASPAPPQGIQFICLFAYPPADALGYTVEGGLHFQPGPSGHFNAFIKPGQVLPERFERIYLTPMFDDINSDLQRLTMIHELAHNVGGKEGTPSGIDEFATVDRPAVWKALSPFKRLHTADSYGFFATECNIGTDTAVVRCLTTADAVGEWPKVTTSFIAPEPVIAMPPASNPAAAKLQFPADFT